MGDPSLDNTNFADRDDFSFLMRMERGGADPAEPDYDALRQALWMKFDAQRVGSLLRAAGTCNSTAGITTPM